jgi:signal transduction histidine kinase/ActR/RegA family two-component response regulator
MLLRRLTALSRAMAQTGSLDGLLELAARQAAAMLGVSRTLLMLVGDDGRAHVRAHHGVDASVAAGLSGELDEALISRVEHALAAGTRSFMAVPLIVQGEVTGLLAAVRDDLTPWTPLDEATLTAVADQSAAPIEIARLSEEVRQARLVQENARLYEAERAARSALADERARLTTVLDNIPAGVILLEAASGSATFANPTAARLLRQPQTASADDVYQALAACPRADGRPYSREELPATRALTSGMTVLGEDVEFGTAGEPRTFSVNAAPIHGAGGTVVASAITFHDVTQRRAVERHLGHVQRLEVVGRLAGGVAHETNNQMSVVLGAAAFLLRRTDLAEAARDDVKTIQRAAERTAAVTSQLLAFSRRQVWRSQVLEADAVIRELAPVLNRTIGEQSLVGFRLGSPGVQIRLDRGQLEQTLLNLAINARDAMPRGGEVTLETRLVQLGTRTEGAPPGVLTRPGAYLRLDFRDTGVGMTSETLGHLFEPFFTTKPVGKGTGLGLASVYGIVKQGHGYVWAASEPGQGATFTIHFPVATDAPVGPVFAPFTGGASPGEVVLVVEDDPEVLVVSARALRDAGYMVLQAQNGREALEAVERHAGRVDLVLADVAMPGVDGRELAELLRRSYPDVAVLLMSGRAGDAADAGLGSGGEMFLQKPFSPDELADRVRALLDERRNRA